MFSIALPWQKKVFFCILNIQEMGLSLHTLAKSILYLKPVKDLKLRDQVGSLDEKKPEVNNLKQVYSTFKTIQYSLKFSIHQVSS
jgi:hypothetical protein